MFNREHTIAQEYARAVFYRATAPDALEPEPIPIDWDDQPSRHKIYQQVDRIALPLKRAQEMTTLGAVLHGLQGTAEQARCLSMEEIAALLFATHGVLNRRLDINWNRDEKTKRKYHLAVYGRGTPSGGGLYPTEFYWISGGSGVLLPGVYHYDNAHHAMERLLVADVTQEVRQAMFEQPAALATDQFLLITLAFWKSAFKYKHFSYHVGTMDLGALLGSLRFAGLGLGIDLPCCLWFQDELLNRLLGIATQEESVFAVVPMPGIGGALQERAPSTRIVQHGESVQKKAYQRSKVVRTFPGIKRVHQATLITQERAPSPDEVLQAPPVEEESKQAEILLPALTSESLQKDMWSLLTRRQSTFGRFAGQKALPQATLATILSFGAAARGAHTDLKRGDGTPYLTRLAVFVNNVADVPPGAYLYDHEQHGLQVQRSGNVALALQECYFLKNYNLAMANVVFAIVGRVADALEVYGNRGYRILNVEVGTVAQALYLASTSCQVGCGAGLGFDGAKLTALLNLEASEEQALLIVLMGHVYQAHAAFDARLL